MNTEWERVNRLFHEATEFAGAERAEFIARASQNDIALQREIQSLIVAYEEDNGFLESPALGKDLCRQFGGWQREIIDALQTPAGKADSGQDRMIGQLLDGKYEIEELCGRGGMGAVYRATHVGTGRRVAVKVIAPELAGNSEFIERFRREAKTIGLLRHPNIVNVTDFGVSGEGAQTVAYLVMEYLEGQTLAERLKNGRQSPIDQTNCSSITQLMYERMKDPRQMPVNEAIAILSQTCAAMDEAHRLGILHRDLKPENIWLEPTGPYESNVKILDFGIARLQDIFALDDLEPPAAPDAPAIRPQPFSVTEAETLRFNGAARNVSRFSAVMGTPEYMSPEQCRGEQIDKTSDVYSLGVIAYQMLAGEPPFTGTTPELLIQHREAHPAPLREKRRDIPTGVDAVVRQALAKDKNARPATAGAFAAQLQLNSEGNEWIRLRADELNRKYRWKFVEIALRMQWKGWLLSLLLLFATLKLPGMSAAPSVAVFGFLWLALAAITILGQNKTTAACALFLEQLEGGVNRVTDLRSIVAAVRRRSRDLALAAFRLIIPPLINEGLSVEGAKRRWSQLTAPLRRQTAYTLFRRVLVFALALTSSQQILMAAAFPLDRGLAEFNTHDVFMHDMSNSLFFWPPVALMIWIATLIMSLKSAIEQFVLYLAARKAHGEIPLEQCSILTRHNPETGPFRWRLHWKTYAPICAFIALIIGFHLSKFPWMTQRARESDLYSVKASHASGVPVPLWWSQSNFSIWQIEHSPAMAKYMIEKETDINAPVRLYGAKVNSTLLMAALYAHSVDTARLLIERGADVRGMNSFGQTPMTLAIFHCPAAIEPLLASGADINEQTLSGPPLLTAARYQWISAALSTFFFNGDIALKKRDTASVSLSKASSLRVIEEREELIREQDNAVRILIEKGADPNMRDAEGRNGLMLMSMDSLQNRGAGFSEELTIETRETIEPNVRMRRPDKAVELIGEALLKAGCDVNAVDNDGRTPLMYAVALGRPTIVKLLLQRGANISAKDHNGASALDWALKSANHEILMILSQFSHSGENKTFRR